MTILDDKFDLTLIETQYVLKISYILTAVEGAANYYAPYENTLMRID